MKNKFSARIVCCFLIILLVIEAAPVLAESGTGSPDSVHTVDEVQALIDGIVAYDLKIDNAISIQEWIDTALSANAGLSGEWYIMGFAQSGKNYDFSAYAQSLEKYLEKNKIENAVSRQKLALALVSVGRASGFATSALNKSIGELGIISWVFGLHLLNNGCASSKYTPDEVVSKLLSMRLSDGGWALSGKNSDTDVTAMVIQALAPYYEKDESVRSAVEGALELLSERQLPDGGYKSYGSGNPESSAQVIIALSSLGLDCEKDGRFSKNGKTPLDGLLKYRLEDGSFAHAEGGETDGSATFQAFVSLVALKRVKEGRGPFYVFDLRPDAYPEAPEEETTAETTTADTEKAGPEGKGGVPAPLLCICAAIAVPATAVCLLLCVKKKRHN